MPTRRIAGSSPLLLVLGLAACGSGAAAPPAAPATSKAPAPVASSAADRFTSPRTYQEVALPTRVRIPSQRIDSRLGRVGLAADRTVDAPDDYGQAAWYDRGPRPGQRGPAIIVGHVDSTTGAAVFFRLGSLRAGDQVLVDRADGSTARFRVTRRDQFPKAGFPAEQVYSPTLKASLLLITCGGTFDHHTGHYRDNIVVTAVPE